MSDLADEDYNAEQNLSGKDNTKSKPASTMFLYLRELFFLFALVFTSYTALFSSLPKVGKAPTPVPFFNRNTVVVDYYRGTVNAAFQRASEVDLTIVMYYAPWDADSQAARDDFETAAKFFKNEVFFTAISCWSPGSECKQHVPKIRHFPVIVAYPQHSKGIHYQGPFKSVYIIQFVKTLMRPLQRITSSADIVYLTSHYNVLVVGAFMFSGNLGAAGYYTFYSTALKMLEKDPHREIGFAVTTDNEMAFDLGFDSVPSIRIYLWNETYDYSPDADYTEDSLVKWIWLKKHRVIQWISPVKMKSQNLSPHVINKPALILFTPRNPFVETNPMFSMLKGIAYKYHNCNNNQWVKHLSYFIQIQNGFLKFTEDKIEKYCQSRKKKMEMYKSSIELPSVIVPTSFLNISKSVEEDVCDTGGFYSKYVGPQSEICYRKSKAESVLFNTMKLSQMYHHFTEADPRSPKNLFEAWEDEKCQTVEHGNSYFRLPYPALIDNLFSTSIDGLACSNNRTLSIIAMDSLLHYQFAEGLGINILELKDKTAVAIIDNKEDSQFIMNGPVNTNNIISFIIKHTNGKLSRFLRSTHDAESRSVMRHRYPIRPTKNCIHTDTESCVPELNSKNFLEYVLDQSRAVIIFYHTPYCALCRSISHLFLLLSRYFRHFPGLMFARIDGENNDLPWEYTMDLFPSLLFFPTLKKSDSRLYSNDLPFTIKNLIHFVLANLEPEAKIPAMMSLCLTFEKLQSETEAKKCKWKMQKESYEYLSETLKNVRKLMNVGRNLPPTSKFFGEIRRRKQVLIRKLEYFKTIHFMLGSVDRIHHKSNIVADIVKLYTKFLHLIRSNFYYLNYEGYS